LASLIKPGSVKLVTKDGEIQVSLTIDLNLNINADGSLGSSSTETSQVNEESKVKSQNTKEKFEWAIPDFEDAPKINFGKKEV
jgi:hypothetical protein